MIEIEFGLKLSRVGFILSI